MIESIGSEPTRSRRRAFERRSKIYVPIHVAVCMAVMSLPAFGFIDGALFSLTQRLPPSRLVPTLIAESAYLLPLAVGVLVCRLAAKGDRWAWAALWMRSLTGAVLSWIMLGFGQLMRMFEWSYGLATAADILAMLLSVSGLFFRAAWFELLLPRAGVSDRSLQRKLDWTATVLCSPMCFFLLAYSLAVLRSSGH